MYAFLSNLKPHSANRRYEKKYKENYRKRLHEDFNKYNSEANPLEENLYGLIYYFHNIPTQLDADNISKPIWDVLNSIAYLDDRNIKLRIAGIFDLRSEPIDTLKMSESILVDFLGMINESRDHILYIEIGRLDYSLFEFEYEMKRGEI